MSILNSRNSNFIFNLPKTFLYKEVEDRWLQIVKREPIPFLTTLDFINHGIQEINFPSMSMEPVTQVQKYGDKKDWKNSIVLPEMFDKTFNVKFKMTNGCVNYWILFEQLNRYLDWKNKIEFMEDFVLYTQDNEGNVLMKIIMQEVIMMSISELTLAFTSNSPETNTFDVSFKYNDLKIELVDA